MPLTSLTSIVPTAPADSIEAAKAATAKHDLQMLRQLPLDDIVNTLANKLAEFALHLIIAILVFYLGRFIIRKLYKVMKNIMVHRNVDRSLATFTLSLVKMVLYFILIVTIIGILGLETSSFLALFASAGVAVGMALSGTLQNFAGGVLILLLKPYKIGDYIEAQGFAGTVKEIQIFHTIILTYDNKSIIIPNGGLSTGSINNWNREAYRRVDWTIGISYGQDVALARQVMMDLLMADDRIVKTTIEEHERTHSADGGATTAHKDARSSRHEEAHTAPEPSAPGNDDEDTAADEDAADEQPRTGLRGLFGRLFHTRRQAAAARLRNMREGHRAKVRAYEAAPDRKPSIYLKELGDSAVVLSVRAWTRTSDYWGVFFDFNERFYVALPATGKLGFPFPQMTIHVDPSDSRLPVSIEPEPGH